MLESAAERAIAGLSEEFKRADMIRLRRRLRARKIRPEVCNLDQTRGQQLLDALGQREKLLTQLREEETSVITDEMRALIHWAADPRLQDSIAMTSLALATSVVRLAEYGNFDKTARRSLPAFVRYHARSIARVSPFAGYTAVGVATAGDACCSATLETRTSVATSRLVYRLLVRVLQSGESTRHVMPWKVNELIDWRLSELRIYARNPRGTVSSRFEGSAERTVSIPRESAWAAVVESLEQHTSATETFGSIVTHLATESGSSEEHAVIIAHKLAEIGAIVPVLPVAEHSTTFAADWSVFLRTTLGADHGLTRLHEDTERTRQRLPTLHGRDRIEALGSLHARWNETLRSVIGAEEFTNDLFLEDSYVNGPLDPYDDVRTRWEADVRRLRPLLKATDNHAVFAAVVDNAFVAQYGPTGECDNLLELSELVASRIEATISNSSDTPNVRLFESELSDSARATRARARALLESWASQPGVEYVIPEHDINVLRHNEVAPTRRTTLAVHGHPSDELLIVNHFYGGPGVYLSRFTAGLTADQRIVFEEYVRSAIAEDAFSMQLRPTFGFNANLSPELAESVLRTPNEPHIGEATSRSVADLAVRRVSGQLRLIEKETGRNIELRYFGFLVPFVLPSLERMLTAYWGGPAISFDVFDDRRVAVATRS